MTKVQTAIGQFPPFNPDTDKWAIYAERLEFVFLANGIKEKDISETNTAHNKDVQEQKRAILLTVIGTSTYTLLRTIIAPKKPQAKTYDQLTSILAAHFEPVPKEIVESFKFYRRDRKPGETVTEYISAIRQLSEFCNFGTMLNRMLRDRIVCGINDDYIQKQLLDIENIDLDKAMAKALALETIENDVRIIKGQPPEDSTVNRIFNQHNPRSSHNGPRPTLTGFRPNSTYYNNRLANYQRRSCARCTSLEHPEWECPYKTYECRECHTIGHLAKACKKKLQNRYTRPRPDRQPYQTNANFINGTPDAVYNVNSITKTAYVPEYDIFTIHELNEQTSTTYNRVNAVSKCTPRAMKSPINGPPPMVKITCLVNNNPISFQLDTGSGYTIMSEAALNTQLKYKGLLNPGPGHLMAYTGHALDIKGQLNVNVTYKGKTLELPLVIVAGQRPNLLGRNWIYSDFNIIPRPDGVNHIESSQRQLQELLEKHKRLFSPGMGCLKGVKVKLHVRRDAPTPKFYKARSLPYHLKDDVEDELRRLESEDIITPVAYAEFATPIVPLRKKNNTVRLCGDFKITTNKIIDTEKYPLPRVNDIFAKLAGCKIFARIDMRNAYNQLELDEESKNYVIINTTKGLYRYNRLPFGVSSSSAIFQRHLELLLQDHPCSIPFQDDILVGGQDDSDLLDKLAKVFATFEDAGLKLNQEKCQFLKTSVDFLGYRLDPGGLHPQEEKVAAIRDAPAPRTVEGLRSFLGLINYYSRFIPNSATLLSPLYELLNKSSKWQWTQRHQDTFDKAKQAIQSSGLLVLFDPRREVILACDASPVGIGAVISHRIDNIERPIAFASRTLNHAEKIYPQIEREALAIIFGVTHFRDYLLGKRFSLITDHKPLTVIFSEDKPVPPMAAARLQRWALMLSAYDYTITYKKGILNSNADALSRLPLPSQNAEPPLPTETVFLIKAIDEGPINTKIMRKETMSDPILSRVTHHVIQGWPRSADSLPAELKKYYRRTMDISTADGILLIGNRVIVPTSLRRKITEELHSTHQGVRSMKEMARAKVWWPGIDQELEEMSKSCEICRIHAPLPPQQFSPWPCATAPWRRVHLDFAGPIEQKYLLVTVDSYSKWMEVDITNSTSSANVIKHLRQHMARFGVIPLLITDNATCFTSEEFQTFSKDNGIHHLTTAPYHPASNGQAERSVRTVKNTLKKITDGRTSELALLDAGLQKYSSGSLELRIARFLLNYRRTPVNGGPSPAEMMLNRPILTKLDLFHPSQRADAKVEEEATKPQGQPVLARNFGKGDKWIRGYTIKQHGRLMYEIQTESGPIIRRHRNQLRFSTPAEQGVVLPSNIPPDKKAPNPDRNTRSPIIIHIAKERFNEPSPTIATPGDNENFNTTIATPERSTSTDHPNTNADTYPKSVEAAQATSPKVRTLDAVPETQRAEPRRSARERTWRNVLDYSEL